MLLQHAVALLAVDPVKWARSQMAFTLGFHIILVPLGVSWAFMTLVANYRAIKKNDADALLLAQRWSKYMAVTFAVGAVTGTVLTFEFGLLWPKFMGRFGAAFGVPFAIEGLFFFTEAIFIAIYIYGWRRLKPWPHFWTGVPVVIAGIGGTVSVIAANAWMNEPAGFTLDSAGKVVDVDPWGVIFNKAFPLEAAHMFVAAYVVGGFLIASVYATGMLRGRRDRYHRLGFIIPFTVAAVMTPIQMGVGDALARWVFANEPAKFAAIELVPETSKDVPETLLGHMNSDGKVVGGIPIPGLASWLSDPSDGKNTIVRGRLANPALGSAGAAAVSPASDGPTIAEANVVHLAWDVMVGLGTLLALLSVWYGLSWIFKRDYPQTKWFLRIAACCGVLSVITMEAGWVVTEVGRQPWIVHDYMKVEDAATANTGVWITFLAVVGIYAVLGVTTILVLRGMSKRWREQGGGDDTGGPYETAPEADMNMINATAVILFFGVTAYALFGGADFGAGFWDLIAGGAERGERPRALIDHSIGPVWEANHVWLIFCLVVLWTAFSEAFASITLTLFVPLTLAAFGIVLRGSSFAFRKAVLRTRDRRNFGAAFALSSVLVPYCMGSVAGAIASGRVPAGGKAGDPWSSWINPTSIVGGLLAVAVCAYLSAVYLVWDARRLGDPDLAEYFRRRAIIASLVAGAIAAVGIVVFHSDAHYLYSGLTSRALPLVIASGVCGIASLVLLLRDATSWARFFSIGAVATVVIGWGVAQWPYMLPTSLKVSEAAGPSGTLAAVMVVFGLAAVTIVPALGLLYVLDQKSLLVGEGASDEEPATAG